MAFIDLSISLSIKQLQTLFFKIMLNSTKASLSFQNLIRFSEKQHFYIFVNVFIIFVPLHYINMLYIHNSLINSSILVLNVLVSKVDSNNPLSTIRKLNEKY